MIDVAKLLEQCRRGDPLAWEALVRKHQARVYATAYHYLRDAEEARDVAQEVFVKVYRGLGSFEGDRIVPWLLRLTRNCSIDRLRRLRARPPASDVQVDDGAPLPDTRPGPHEAWSADDRKRLVHRALDGMSEQNREIILLKEIQGLAIAEIAEMLGVPVGTVKSRSNRARTELARRILELDPSYGAP